MAGIVRRLEGAAWKNKMVTNSEVAARRFKVLLEWDAGEDVWVSYVPTLGYLSNYGDTREEALEQTGDAILGYLGCRQRGNPCPTPRGRSRDRGS